jgi:hypothetical protein
MTALCLQTDTQVCCGTTQVYNLPSRALSPPSYTDAFYHIVFSPN